MCRLQAESPKQPKERCQTCTRSKHGSGHDSRRKSRRRKRRVIKRSRDSSTDTSEAKGLGRIVEVVAAASDTSVSSA